MSVLVEHSAFYNVNFANIKGKILAKTQRIIEKDPFNLFQPSLAFHIETSHLFRRTKQITGFYMKRNTGLKWGKPRTL